MIPGSMDEPLCSCFLWRILYHAHDHTCKADYLPKTLEGF